MTEPLPAPAAPAGTVPTRRRRRWWVVIVILIVLALGAIIALQKIGLSLMGMRAIVQEGPSMEPALRQGDRFLIGESDAIQLGDIVVFATQGEGGEIDVSKRVVGLEGDRIEIGDELRRNGQLASTGRTADPAGASSVGLTVGARCHEERLGNVTYATLRGDPSSRNFSLTVPTGHVFVLGDHRDHSADSRLYGPVPVAKIRGRFISSAVTQQPRVECKF